MPKLKTIKIKSEIHKKLLDKGKKSETFSDIIERLIKKWILTIKILYSVKKTSLKKLYCQRT